MTQFQITPIYKDYRLARYARLSAIVLGVAILLSLTAYAMPRIKEYNRQAYIEHLTDYQKEQHELANQSRERENDYRVTAQLAITKAEQEEENQMIYGQRWSKAQAEINSFQ